MEIDFLHIDIKNFYSYRSNRCSHSFVIDNVPFNKIKEYVEEQGFRMDNHISWENKYGLCFTYSDHRLYVGYKMTNKSW